MTPWSEQRFTPSGGSVLPPLRIASKSLSLWALVALVLPGNLTLAQAPPSDVTFLRNPDLRIPFSTNPNGPRLQEIRLYCSLDSGSTWQRVGTAVPQLRGEFSYRADRDGMYWFAVQEVDLQGRANPVVLQGPQPYQIKVYVDTHDPVITLRALNGRDDGSVGVEWDIRDESLDVSSLALQYRPPGSNDWIPLPIANPGATGQHFWSPGINGAIEVRMRARDFAKNVGEAKMTLATNGLPYNTPGGGSDGFSNQDASQPRPGTRWVNSKHISINYEIKDIGPSGVSKLELWVTPDGRNWKKYKEEDQPKPPLTFDVENEGIYGFTILLRSGVNLSERPPHSGDAPQMWVEVDLTKPIIQYVDAEVGQGFDTGKVIVRWKAKDERGLARTPITLSYSKDENGPWTPIESNLENTERYVWNLSPSVPPKFFLRVEAVDRAGNVGALVKPDPVIIDLHKPKGVILDVKPAEKPGYDGGAFR